ncbi:MAG: ABC transporter permease [Myxococcota bacterium]|nr:ABC transporter permease [Myxococcota bacterium]
MSPAVEIRLLVAREMRRSVRSVKGMALSALTLIGAFVTSLVCVWIEGLNRAGVGATSTPAFVEMKRALIEKATGDASFASYAASIPWSLITFLKITLWFGPLLIALLGFDSVAGELQHRSIRYWALRSRRASYFAAKVLGLWIMVGIITLAMNVLAAAVVLGRGYLTVGELLGWGLRFWGVAFVIFGVWAALATLVSSCFRSPMPALLSTVALFFVIWLLGLGGLISRQAGASPEGGANKMVWYEYINPNSYDTLLLARDTTQVLAALGILLAFIAVTIGTGALLLQRRDI